MRKLLIAVLYGLIGAISCIGHAQQTVVVIPLGEVGPKAPSAPDTESQGNNDTLGFSDEAYTILESSEFTGSISPSGDVDWYKIYIPFQGCFHFSVTVQAGGGDTCSPSGDIDTELTLIDSNGSTELDFNDDIDVTNNHCSMVQGGNAVGGARFYYIGVRSSTTFCPSCTFNYKIMLSHSPSLCI